MTLGIKFTVGRRSQNFNVRSTPGGLSFARISANSMRELWFSVHTSADVSESGSFRAASEHIGFSMGNTYQRFELVVPDCFYDYEADQDRMYAADHDVWRDGHVQSFTPPF